MVFGSRLVRCIYLFYILCLGVLSGMTTIFSAWLLIELLSFSHVLSPALISGSPITLLLIGLVFLPFVVLVACRAFTTKNHSWAVLFWVLVCIGAVLSVSLGVWSLILQTKLPEQLELDLKEDTKPALRNEIEKKQWDYIQKSLECCGVRGASDYLEMGAMPMSCCNQVEHVCARVHPQGCLSALADFGVARLTQVALASAIIAISLLVGIYVGCSYSTLLKRTPKIKIDAPPEDIPLTQPNHHKIFLRDQMHH